MGARLPGIADRSCTGVPQGSSRIDNLCMWSISIPAIRCPWDYSLPARSMLAPCIIKVHCLLRAFKKSRSAAKYMYLCAHTHTQVFHRSNLFYHNRRSRQDDGGPLKPK